MPFLDLSKMNEPQVTEVRHPQTNQLVMVLHTQGGVMHREDGPAATYYNADGQAWAQEWYHHGKVHRDNGPARMYLKHPQPRGEEIIAANGELVVEWHFHGQFHQTAVLDHQTFHQHWHKENK